MNVMRLSALKKIGREAARWAFCLLLIFVVWIWAAANSSRAFVVGPREVGRRSIDWITDGTMWDLVRVTMSEAALGFVLGVSIGLFVALFIGVLPPFGGKVLEPFVVAVYAMPKFILVPILFVWLGLGFTSRVFIVTVAVFPVVAIYTLSGLSTVDPGLMNMMGLLGANRIQITRKLLLPHTLGYILTAVVFAFPRAVTIALGAEILFGTTEGLGGMLNNSAQLFNATNVLTALAATVVLSTTIRALLQRVASAMLGPTGRREL